MDFDGILKRWEGINDRSSQKTSSIMEEWLQKNEVFDKDANLIKIPARGENRRRLVNKKPDAIIDIHCLTSENAWLSLEQFFEDAKLNGFEKLRIIHGKGSHAKGEDASGGFAAPGMSAVLKSTVRKFIEQCEFAGESGFEKNENGGSGATWVFIKKIEAVP